MRATTVLDPKLREFIGRYGTSVNLATDTPFLPLQPFCIFSLTSCTTSEILYNIELLLLLFSQLVWNHAIETQFAVLHLGCCLLGGFLHY